MKFRDGAAPYGSSRDGAERAIASAREVGRVGPIGGSEFRAAGLEGRSEPHALASISAGDHAHEDPVLAHEMMKERPTNMYGHKAGDGRADHAMYQEHLLGEWAVL